MNEAAFRKLTAGWPGVTLDVKWGDDFVASVAGKMFAVYGLRGSRAGSLSFKVPDEHFLALTEQPGIEPAPYAARFKWIAVVEPRRYGKTWLGVRIRESYELVAARLPKKTQRELGLPA